VIIEPSCWFVIEIVVNDRLKCSKGISIVSPVMAILQDHLLVPSRTICSACSRLSMCVSGSTENVVLKRRQFPRHRIVLRQPLLVLLLLSSLFSRSEKRVPLVAAFSRRVSRRLYGGHRRTRDRHEAREIVRNQSNAIQQQRRSRSAAQL